MLNIIFVFTFCLVMCFSAIKSYAMDLYTTHQAGVMSEQCPTGGEEAEKIYQQGRAYRQGHGGLPVDKAKAEKLFEEALVKGNAKAPLVIGQMYMYDYSSKFERKKRHKYMIAMYEQSAKMGCPEAYGFLAECYDNGWGVRTNPKKAMELLIKSAEMGSPKGMEFYGTMLTWGHQFSQGTPLWHQQQVALGRKWLQRSMQLGNGDAGIALSKSYKYEEGNIEGIIQSLRAGAKLGSKACLSQLYLTYIQGYYGQDEDKDYATFLEK